jgi:hypothetical protein
MIKGKKTMSNAIDHLQAAQQSAMAGRPKVGGFPYLAETLRRAGLPEPILDYGRASRGAG